MAKKKKSLPKLKKEAQIVFNAFIRKRDEGLGCISCGQHKVLQCGHFFPVGGYDGLRFNEHNANGECAGCNCFDEAHLIHYRDNLEGKIGADNLALLYQNAADYKKHGYKFSRSEVEEIIKEYKLKLRNYG